MSGRSDVMGEVARTIGWSEPWAGRIWVDAGEVKAGGEVRSLEKKRSLYGFESFPFGGWGAIWGDTSRLVANLEEPLP